MKVTALDRLTFAVKDIDQAAGFFSNLLNMSFDGIKTSSERNFKVVYGKLGSSSGIELLQPTTHDSMVGKFIEKRGEGVYNLVLRVDDIEEATKHFQAQGMHLRGYIKRNNLKEVIFNPNDTYNIPIVLAEYPEMHPATCASRHFEGEPVWEQKLYP